jgi:hypothetical protein
MQDQDFTKASSVAYLLLSWPWRIQRQAEVAGNRFKVTNSFNGETALLLRLRCEGLGGTGTACDLPG